MKITSRHYRKPDLLVLLTLFVGCGMLATTLAQAAEPAYTLSGSKSRVTESASADWLHTLWSIDLAGKLASWKPKISVDDRGEGIQLMRPFGARGPALRVLNGIPVSTGSNRYGSDRYDDSSTYLDTYLFLEKRW
ncbi:MAG: hypothetical protein ACE5FQ_02450 [Thiogranum sp.]